MCLVETQLKGDEGVVFDDYQGFGHNSALVSRKAVRGSGGVRWVAGIEIDTQGLHGKWRWWICDWKMSFG